MVKINSYSNTLKRIGWKTLLLALALNILTYTIAFAASGDLDPTFSGDGKVTTNIGGALVNDAAWGLAVQSDGKIVTVGDHYNAAGDKSDFTVVRYKPDGALDTTFSEDGKLTTNFRVQDQAHDVALQPDGKIVVAGQACAANYVCDLAVARYNPDGSLDTTFSGDGKVTKDFGGGDNGSLGGLAIQSDGKIIIAGYMHNGSSYDFAIYRFNENGTLDTTFSRDGMVNISFGSGRNDFARDIAIASGGKLVVVGESRHPG